MGLFFIYTLKAAVCQTAFYLLYKLLLSRDTFHGFNRAVLLLMTAASLILPLISIQTGGGEPLRRGVAAVEQIVISADVVTEDAPAGMSVIQVLGLIYIIGAAAFTVRGAVSAVSLRRLISRGRVAERSGGVRTVVIEGDIAPFSVFSTIVISEKDYACHPDEILTHERAHIARRHTLDLLFMNVMTVFQWFNPAAWLIKRELQDVHEYEADAAVLLAGVDAASYQLLLIRKAVGERLFALANNLTQSSLKKRIGMMQARRSCPWGRMKAAFTVPVVIAALFAFAGTKAEELSREIETEGNLLSGRLQAGVASAKAIAAADTVPEASFTTAAEPVAEVETAAATPADDGQETDPQTEEQADGQADVPAKRLPQYPGGMAALKEYVNNNIRYPESAAKAGIEGRVILQFTIDREGNVNKLKVMKSVSADIDAEAIRLVEAMPKWTPGYTDGQAVNVRYTMPVTFRLPKAAPEAAKQDTEKASAKDAFSRHYYVVDGVHVSADNVKALNSGTIKDIQILKGDNAVRLYGSEAKDGAVIIRTKNTDGK